MDTIGEDGKVFKYLSYSYYIPEHDFSGVSYTKIAADNMPRILYTMKAVGLEPPCKIIDLLNYHNIKVGMQIGHNPEGRVFPKRV